jgi:polar amino acid transport system substrate-binding protein
MMKKIIIILIFCLLSISANAQEIPNFTIMTEDWAPYNFSEAGETRGISTDIMVLMLKKIGSSQTRSEIELLPWARAYEKLKKEPNTILFTTTRTKKRENMFKWVGPIFEIDFYLWALKSEKIQINSAAELVEYRIGTLRYDVLEDILIEETGMKVSDFDRVSRNLFNTKKLYAKRVNLIATSAKTIQQTSKELELNPNLFEKVYSLGSKSMNFAFHKDTPDSIINLFETAFFDLKQEGEINKIFDKYTE